MSSVLFGDIKHGIIQTWLDIVIFVARTYSIFGPIDCRTNLEISADFCAGSVQEFDATVNTPLGRIVFHTVGCINFIIILAFLKNRGITERTLDVHSGFHKVRRKCQQPWPVRRRFLPFFETQTLCMTLLVFCMLQPMTEAAEMTVESYQLVVNTSMLTPLVVIAGQNQYTIVNGSPIAHTVVEQRSTSDEPKINPVAGRVRDGSKQSNAADTTNDTQSTEDFQTNAKAVEGDPVVAAPTRRAEQLAPCHDGSNMQELLTVCFMDGNKQRRTQIGCDSLPDHCSQVCAPAFEAFYTRCPSLATEIEGATTFHEHEKCATASHNIPPPPVQHNYTCEDSDDWVGAQDQRCQQHSIEASSSWHATCNADKGTAARNGTSSTMITTTVACLVACETCPHCDDGQENGDENVACVPFEQSRLLGQNLHAICDGTFARFVCRTVTVAQARFHYTQVQGDGDFICVNGRWLGHLLFVPTDCGVIVDQQPVDASGFAPCTNGTTLGSTCDAQCQEHVYAEAGTLTTFTCADEYGGKWLEQGSPWYQSSLVCI
eukprot:SAG11_NODE_5079_length_1671_cov_1.441476_1_plen_544_part_01